MGEGDQHPANQPKDRPPGEEEASPDVGAGAPPAPPEPTAADLRAAAALPDDALLDLCRIETFRAGGPGGQHQNKAETGVRITHVASGLTVTARDSRSQHRNRRLALARLREALRAAAHRERPRIATKVPASAKRRRREAKRRRSETKRRRKKPDVPDADD